MIRYLSMLIVSLMMTACAGGMPRTSDLNIDESTISQVEQKCQSSYPTARSGTMEDLWVNKRAILRQARDCAEAARVLAGKARNRNEVIGN